MAASLLCIYRASQELAANLRLHKIAFKPNQMLILILFTPIVLCTVLCAFLMQCIISGFDLLLLVLPSFFGCRYNAFKYGFNSWLHLIFTLKGSDHAVQCKPMKG